MLKYLLLLSLLVASKFAAAQPYQIQKIDEKYCVPNTLIFKVKVANGISLMPKDHLLKKLNASTPQKKFPHKRLEANIHKNNGDGKKKIDLSLFYTIQIDAKISLEAAIQLLSKDPNIAYVEPIYQYKPLGIQAYTPNDALIANQTYLTNIKAYEGWEIQKGDPSMIIGVSDFGFETTHADLTNNITNPWNLPDNNANVAGANGSFTHHGTMSAGVAGASTDNNTGIAGVGFNCKVMPLLMFNGTIDKGMESIVYAADNGCKVINASWGRCYGGPLRYEQDIIDYAVFNKDAVVVFAAGNQQLEWYPANYDNVLSVTATDNTDKRFATNFPINYGCGVLNAEAAYNYEVDISAPGQNIYSSTVGNTYTTDGGTSFSAPQVAGAAALVRVQFPTLTAPQVMARLKATADNIDNLNLGNEERIGKGRLNVYRALSDVNVKAITLNNWQWQTPVGNYAIAGQNINLTCDFTNQLSALSNLQLTLSCSSPYVSIIKNNASIGSVGSGATTNNNSDVFTILIAPNTPANTPVYFRIGYQDGAFIDYEYFKEIINPDFINIDINQLAFNTNNSGKLANLQYPYQVGITYQDVFEVLAESGLLVGTSNTKVSNTISNYNGTRDQHFTNTKNFTILSGGPTNFEAENTFTDTISNPNNIGVVITQKTYAWQAAPTDKFVIVGYRVKNISNAPIANLQVSLFADWDLQNYTLNRADWDNTNKLGYVYNTQGGGLYAGIQLLTAHTPNYYAIDNTNVGGNNIDMTDGFSLADKYQAISSGLLRTQAGTAGMGNDVCHTLGGTILTLAVGETQTIAFAMMVGSDLADLQNSAVEAQKEFAKIKMSSVPVVNSPVTICKNDNISITPSNGTNFYFYDSQPLVTPIFEGNSLNLNNISNSKTYYITNVDSLQESGYTTVDVEIQQHTADFIIDPDTLDLSKGNSVNFNNISSGNTQSTWDLGDNTTANTAVVDHIYTQAGEYTIELISEDALGCKDTLTKVLKVVDNINTGIEDFAKGNFKIYPNPSEGIFQISSKKSSFDRKIEIWNNLGRKVYTRNSASNETEVFSLQGFAKGIYFIYIYENNQLFVDKLVIY